MPAGVKVFFAVALMALGAGFAPSLHADGGLAQGDSLKGHYDAAENLLRANKLDQAADQFRAFLAEAIGELAMGRTHLGEYAKAAPLFDEALALVPDSPHLRLEFAGASLLNGDFAEAQLLAAAYLKDFPGEASASLAQAHQIEGRALLKLNEDKEARKEFEAALVLDPSFANGYDLAVACLDMDDEACASQRFDELEKSFGDTPSLHMSFGRAYGDSDFAPRAVVEFKKALEENPRQPEAHYCLAAAMLAGGGNETTVQAAVLELKQELAVSPDDFLTYAALGKLAAGQGQYGEAERYLKRATVLNPKNPDAFLYLGQMYFDTNRFAEAEPALRQAIQLTADVSRNRYQIQKAHYLLGRILVQQHHEAEAHAEMQISRDLSNKVLSKDKNALAGMLASAPAPADLASPARDPSVPEAYTAGTADPAAARQFNLLEKQLTPAIADSYNNLGAIEANGAHYADALRFFKRAIAWSPGLEGSDYNLGHAAFMASQFADAVGPLSRYLATHPDNAGIRDALAISQFMTRDYRGCVTTLKRVQNLPASIPQVQFVYADSLIKTGEVAQGEQRLQALETADPAVPDVHRGLGEAFALEGKTQDAVRELETALRLNAGDAEAHFDLGTLEVKQGDTTGAIRELEAAVQLRPGDPAFHRELARAYNLAFRVADEEKEMEIYQKLESAQTPSADSAPPATKSDP
jgi:tetratricopeptide (TPR) repeat protein